MAFKQSGNVVISAASGFSTAQDFVGKNISETVSNLGNRSGSVAINMGTANYVRVNVTGNLSISFAMPPQAAISNTVVGITLETRINSNGLVISWPSGIRWPEGTPPDVSGAGETDYYAIVTYDNGSTFYGFNLGREF